MNRLSWGYTPSQPVTSLPDARGASQASQARVQHLSQNGSSSPRLKGRVKPRALGPARFYGLLGRSESFGRSFRPKWQGNGNVAMFVSVDNTSFTAHVNLYEAKRLSLSLSLSLSVSLSLSLEGFVFELFKTSRRFLPNMLCLGLGCRLTVNMCFKCSGLVRNLGLLSSSLLCHINRVQPDIKLNTLLKVTALMQMKLPTILNNIVLDTTMLMKMHLTGAADGFRAVTPRSLCNIGNQLNI